MSKIIFFPRSHWSLQTAHEAFVDNRRHIKVRFGALKWLSSNAPPPIQDQLFRVLDDKGAHEK